jgi:hypothetical protein
MPTDHFFRYRAGGTHCMRPHLSPRMPADVDDDDGDYQLVLRLGGGSSTPHEPPPSCFLSVVPVHATVQCGIVQYTLGRSPTPQEDDDEPQRCHSNNNSGKCRRRIITSIGNGDNGNEQFGRCSTGPAVPNDVLGVVGLPVAAQRHGGLDL